MAALTPDLARAQRLVVKIGSALLVDDSGLRGDWLRALWSEIAPTRRMATDRPEAPWQP